MAFYGNVYYNTTKSFFGAQLIDFIQGFLVGLATALLQVRNSLFFSLSSAIFMR